MFIHSVYFWLREDLSELDLREFQQGLDSLTKIPDVKRSFVGTPAATDRAVIDRTYSYGLILSFDNQQAHDSYQEHEVHDRFRRDCSRVWNRVLIYDCV